jgi:hypothetical protein
MGEEQNQEAIRGNCGKKFSEHYHESEEFCFTDTNGDLFTDDPTDSAILDMFQPEEIEAATNKWKKLNGHLPLDAS